MVGYAFWGPVGYTLPSTSNFCELFLAWGVLGSCWWRFFRFILTGSRFLYLRYMSHAGPCVSPWCLQGCPRRDGDWQTCPCFQSETRWCNVDPGTWGALWLDEWFLGTRRFYPVPLILTVLGLKDWMAPVQVLGGDDGHGVVPVGLVEPGGQVRCRSGWGPGGRMYVDFVSHI